MMVRKISAAFRKLALIAVAVLGLMAVVNWTVRAGISHSYAILIAQSEEQTASDEKNPPSTGDKEPESGTDKNKESDDAKEKPLKKFQPSEKIEAEQAVDFPYDI